MEVGAAGGKKRRAGGRRTGGGVLYTRSNGRQKEKRREKGWREGAREAVIKSDCIASRMSQESRISGDVKPCLTPQLDNCGCGS